MFSLHDFRLSLSAVSLLFLSGCASITGTNNQSLSVQTRASDGKEVAAAACELTNNKGKWFITTPGSATITRSNDDLQVLCNKAGVEPGRAAVVSATKGSMFGNILLGGGIGMLIDHNNGSAYEYPNFIQVVMGGFVRVEPPPPNNNPAESTVGTQAVVAPTASLAATPSAVPTQSVEVRLTELKKLHDGGLITTQIYLERQRAVLDAKP
jgi:hypothetical protein